eukprot:3921672-Amphidinium_carterae.1
MICLPKCVEKVLLAPWGVRQRALISLSMLKPPQPNINSHVLAGQRIANRQNVPGSILPG